MTIELSSLEVAKPWPVVSTIAGAMRAMNSRDLADQPPIVFVDHHQPILPADEQSMVRHVRNRRGTA